MSLILAMMLSFSLIVSPTVNFNMDTKEALSYSIEETAAGSVDYLSEIGVENELNSMSTDKILSYDTYLEAYYSGLTQNMGENVRNSCGYVSLAQILSFYDSYLDDSIVPEKYDIISSGSDSNINGRSNSPGVMNDKVVVDTGAEYLDEMYRLKDQSLHAKLITIGNELGYYGTDAHGVVKRLEEGNECLTTLSERIEILKAYLDEIGFAGKYTIHNALDQIPVVNQVNLESFVIQNIKQGYPVVLGAKEKESDEIGHVMVCHSYDGQNIRCNLGTTRYGFSYNVKSKFHYFTDAIVLQFKDMTHKHSYNYEIVSSGKKTQHCYCESGLLTSTSEWKKENAPKPENGTLKVPFWVTNIGDSTYSNCLDLRKVTVEDNSFLTCIGNSAFSDCTNLTSFSFEGSSRLTSIKAFAFKGTGLSTFRIPSSVTEIEWTIFLFCKPMSIYTSEKSRPDGWDVQWNVSDIDYAAMLEDHLAGIQRDESYYYSYHNVVWGS